MSDDTPNKDLGRPTRQLTESKTVVEYLRRSFLMIPRPVLHCNDLTLAEKLALAQVFQLAREKGFAYAGQTYIARELGMKRQAVNRLLRSLERKGFLRSTPAADGKRTRNYYLCRHPSLEIPGGETKQAPEGVKPEVAGDETNVPTAETPGCTDVQQRVAPGETSCCIEEKYKTLDVQEDTKEKKDDEEEDGRPPLPLFQCSTPEDKKEDEEASAQELSEPLLGNRQPPAWMGRPPCEEVDRVLYSHGIADAVVISKARVTDEDFALRMNQQLARQIQPAERIRVFNTHVLTYLKERVVYGGFGATEQQVTELQRVILQHPLCSGLCYPFVISALVELRNRLDTGRAEWERGAPGLLKNLLDDQKIVALNKHSHPGVTNYVQTRNTYVGEERYFREKLQELRHKRDVHDRIAWGDYGRECGHIVYTEGKLALVEWVVMMEAPEHCEINEEEAQSVATTAAAHLRWAQERFGFMLPFYIEEGARFGLDFRPVPAPHELLDRLKSALPSLGSQVVATDTTSALAAQNAPPLASALVGGGRMPSPAAECPAQQACRTPQMLPGFEVDEKGNPTDATAEKMAIFVERGTWPGTCDPSDEDG